MKNKVFISGSISIKKLPVCVEESIRKITEQNIEILVGDADGIDFIVQNYCKKLNYASVIVYSIYAEPRYQVAGFQSRYIAVENEVKKERERQQEKDKCMTLESEYSFVIWDGKSKGSYQNILRAIENNKKVKVYLGSENRFLNPKEITQPEIEFIYRISNGYSAAEVVEYLKNEGEDFFQKTRDFNQYLLDKQIIKKEEGVYKPFSEYRHLFIIDKYAGKERGIKFTHDFIAWVEDWIKKIKPPEELSLFDI